MILSFDAGCFGELRITPANMQGCARAAIGNFGAEEEKAKMSLRDGSFFSEIFGNLPPSLEKYEDKCRTSNANENE